MSVVSYGSYARVLSTQSCGGLLLSRVSFRRSQSVVSYGSHAHILSTQSCGACCNDVGLRPSTLDSTPFTPHPSSSTTHSHNPHPSPHASGVSPTSGLDPESVARFRREWCPPMPADGGMPAPMFELRRNPAAVAEAMAMAAEAAEAEEEAQLEEDIDEITALIEEIKADKDLIENHVHQLPAEVRAVLSASTPALS